MGRQEHQNSFHLCQVCTMQGYKELSKEKQSLGDLNAEEDLQLRPQRRCRRSAVAVASGILTVAIVGVALRHNQPVAQNSGALELLEGKFEPPAAPEIPTVPPPPPVPGVPAPPPLPAVVA